jgi:hypothetical protein
MIIPHLIPLLSLGFVLMLAIRAYWVSYCLEAYNLKTLHYITMSGIDEVAAAELYELWPRHYLYWEWLHWDFRRYVVNIERYDLMQEWTASQLAREDLDLFTFRVELAKVEARDAADRLAAFNAANPDAEPPAP